MKEQWVGLLDCNNFFVSCERLFRPDLLQVPVAVLSSNDGCIVARSKEVKDMDIPMGVPYFKVKDILKTHNVTLFSGNHRLYRAISKRVFNALRTIHPDIQQYSIDEAFFYFTGTKDEAADLANQIKSTVEKLVGIPVSIGLAKSKTLAKVANDTAKRTTGTKVLSTADWIEQADTYAIGSVWGVGRRLSQSLRESGIKTAAEYLHADPARIKQKYGVVGLRLQQELYGVSVLYKNHSKPKQSIMSSRSFGAETTSLTVIEEAVLYHTEQVTMELREMGYCAGVLSVFLLPSRHGDFALQGQGGEHVFDVPVATTSGVARAAIQLTKELFKATVPYKKVGIRVSHLQPKEVAQLALFKEENTPKEDTLQAAIDSINKRFKTGRVHQGFLEGKRAYSPTANLESPKYTSDWKQLAVVKA